MMRIRGLLESTRFSRAGLGFCFRISLLLPLAACQPTASLPPGVTAVEATWLRAQVATAPSLTEKGYLYQFNGSARGGDSWLTKVEQKLKPGTSAPAVIWLHGCEGPGQQTKHVLRIFALAGFSVFAPDSFARPGSRALCNTGNMDSRVALRQAEVRHALAQIRSLAWVDQDRLVLGGFSEGSQAAAAWGGSEFKAHVLIGTNCRHNDGSPSAPLGVPVLNLVGADDSWGYGSGCSLSAAQRARGSLVKRYPGMGHDILYAPEVEAEIKAFLRNLGS